MLNDCETLCDERGCHCLTDGDRPLHQIDHLMVATRSGGRIACFCGSFSVRKIDVILYYPFRLRRALNFACDNVNARGNFANS